MKKQYSFYVLICMLFMAAACDGSMSTNQQEAELIDTHSYGFSLSYSRYSYSIIPDVLISEGVIVKTVDGVSWSSELQRMVTPERIIEGPFDGGGTTIITFSGRYAHVFCEPDDPTLSPVETDEVITYGDNKIQIGDEEYIILSLSDSLIFCLKEQTVNRNNRWLYYKWSKLQPDNE